MGAVDTGAVRSYLLAEHAPLLRTVIECADRVAAGWDGATTTDGDAVAEPFEGCLRAAGVVERFPGLLAGAVDAAGESLSAPPVAAPPYVVVTGVGVVVRATLPGGRLVITVAPFALETDPRCYVRAGETPADVVSVEWRER